MRDSQDFLRLYKGRLGAINFNNMIPVTENNIEKIDLNKICVTTKEKNYQDLLKKQMYWLNRNKASLYAKSSKLYRNYIGNKLPLNLRIRCCNFPLLEEKMFGVLSNLSFILKVDYRTIFIQYTKRE